MENEKFEKAKKLKDNIDLIESKIRHIDKLLKCCGIGCKISGTPSASFIRSGDYHSYNTEFLHKLLEDDKAKFQSELEALKEQFHSI